MTEKVLVFVADIISVDPIEASEEVTRLQEDRLPFLMARGMTQHVNRFDHNYPRPKAIPVVPSQHGLFMAFHVHRKKIDPALYRNRAVSMNRALKRLENRGLIEIDSRGWSPGRAVIHLKSAKSPA